MAIVWADCSPFWKKRKRMHWVQSTLPCVNAISASATPRLVFPMLLRLCQHHVTKAAKNDFAGYETVFNKRMAEILGDMADFPAVLPLHEQGRFMLGYYHQTNALYQKKTNSAEAGE